MGGKIKITVIVSLLIGLVLIGVDSIKCDFKERDGKEKFSENYQSCLKKMQNGGDYSNRRGSGNTGGNHRMDYEFGYDEYGGSDERNWREEGRDLLRVRRQSHDYGNQKSGQSCIYHCIFTKYRMTSGREDLPDKTKMKNFLTKSINNQQLKDFVQDSVQECFHLLEMNNRREKCEFSQNLVNCLNDRAQANCEKWERKDSIFF